MAFLRSVRTLEIFFSANSCGSSSQVKVCYSLLIFNEPNNQHTILGLKASENLRFLNKYNKCSVSHLHNCFLLNMFFVVFTKFFLLSFCYLISPGSGHDNTLLCCPVVHKFSAASRRDLVPFE